MITSFAPSPSGEGLSHEVRSPRHTGPRALSVNSHRKPRSPAHLVRPAIARVLIPKIVPPIIDRRRKISRGTGTLTGTYRMGAGHRWCHLVSHASHLARSDFTRVLRKSGKRARLFLRRRRPFRRDDMRPPDPAFRHHDCRLLPGPHHSLSRQRSRALQEGARHRRVDERGTRARHDRCRRRAGLAGIAARNERILKSPKCALHAACMEASRL